MSRLRGNASGRNGSLRWFCSGCGVNHPISRTVEGIHGAHKFCGANLRRAQKAKPEKHNISSLLLSLEVKTMNHRQEQSNDTRHPTSR